MAKYAEGTTVSVESSRAEIEKLLTRYGATGFVYGWQVNINVIQFEMAGRRIKFMLQLPGVEQFRYYDSGKPRPQSSQVEAQKAEHRRLWRSLVLSIKAKLESVENGITNFEDEFLAHTVMPNGQTVGQWLEPQLGAAYESGQMPPMLPGGR